MHSATVKWYMVDAGKLFALQDFQTQSIVEDNWVNIIVGNVEREENIDTQWNPLTNDFSAELFIMADAAHDNSVEALVYTIVVL